MTPYKRWRGPRLPFAGESTRTTKSCFEESICGHHKWSAESQGVPTADTTATALAPTIRSICFHHPAEVVFPNNGDTRPHRSVPDEDRRGTPTVGGESRTVDARGALLSSLYPTLLSTPAQAGRFLWLPSVRCATRLSAGSHKCLRSRNKRRKVTGQPCHRFAPAHAALKSELSKRRIDNTAHFNVQEEHDQSKLGRQRVSWALPLRESESVSESVSEVLRVYHAHSWHFVRRIAPAVVVGYVAIIGGRQEGQEIARRLPRGFAFLGHETEILEIWVANFVGFLVSWRAFSFSFGAICSAVGQISEGVVP